MLLPLWATESVLGLDMLTSQCRLDIVGAAATDYVNVSICHLSSRGLIQSLLSTGPLRILLKFLF